MVTAKISLAKLILLAALGAVGAGTFESAATVEAAPVDAAPVDAPTVFQPTDTYGIIGCQIDCFTKQVEFSRMPEVIAMYNNCLQQCDGDGIFAAATNPMAPNSHMGSVLMMYFVMIR
ncbi:hypothetical protein BG000_004818 [Podila horticola]|nr:hypothetical protein BG000_004818 [Podila horticola]